MTRVPGVDHPAEQTQAEVTITGRGRSVTARVEAVVDGVVSLRPSVSEFAGQVVVRVGDAVEIRWKGQERQRAAPAAVVAVEQGVLVRWRLRLTGPAEDVQRRRAVRGRVDVPVEAEYGIVGLGGRTLDVSEAGLRAEFDGFGAPPEAGVPVQLTLSLEDGPLTTGAEVVRTHARGARWVLSIRFVDIQEKDQDRVRRRVFQALREERASKADDAPPDLRG